MRLNWSDKQDIQKIIAGFGECEHEQIYASVEQIVERTKSNPVENAMTVFLNQHFNFKLLEAAQDDVDAQDIAQKFLWDYVTKIEQWNYALNIFQSKHSMDEVA